MSYIPLKSSPTTYEVSTEFDSNEPIYPALRDPEAAHSLSNALPGSSVELQSLDIESGAEDPNFSGFPMDEQDYFALLEAPRSRILLLGSWALILLLTIATIVITFADHDAFHQTALWVYRIICTIGLIFSALQMIFLRRKRLAGRNSIIVVGCFGVLSTYLFAAICLFETSATSGCLIAAAILELIFCGVLLAPNGSVINPSNRV